MQDKLNVNYFVLLVDCVIYSEATLKIQLPRSSHSAAERFSQIRIGFEFFCFADKSPAKFETEFFESSLSSLSYFNSVAHFESFRAK